MKLVISDFFLGISITIIAFGCSSLAEICKDHTSYEDLNNMHRNESAERLVKDIISVSRYSDHGQDNLQNVRSSLWPKIMMAILVSNPTPFLQEQLAKLLALDYPKRSVDVFVYNNVPFHTSHIEAFRKKAIKMYGSFREIFPTDGIPEHKVYDILLDYWIKRKSDYYFAVKSIVHLDNPLTLKFLVKQNKTVTAPILVWPNRTVGRKTDAKRYTATTYKNIGNCYLISTKLLEKYDNDEIFYQIDNLDDDIGGIHMQNSISHGHLVDPFHFDIRKTSPDIYEIFTNTLDWEARYIDREYFHNFHPGNQPIQPCRGVFWFPVATQRFCQELIHLAEFKGKWANDITGPTPSGENDADRYRVHPLQFFLYKIDLETHWNAFLGKYVFPLRKLVSKSFDYKTTHPGFAFFGRYKSYEQSSTRPHFDTSSFTLNLVLSQHGVDYEGGGCRFLRDNCSVIGTRPGWILMHDGAITHEGLPVISGTRYIIISFVS